MKYYVNKDFEKSYDGKYHNFFKKNGKKNATSLEWHMNCHNYYINNSF
jgi:hypothetical protein